MRVNKTALKLVLGISGVVLVMGTMTISTYSWFMSNAKAAVNVTDPQVIGSDDGIDLTLYYFNGNGTPSADGSGYAGYTNDYFDNTKTEYVSSYDTITLADDFTEASNSTLVANCLNFSKIRPGRRYTFALRSQNLSGVNVSFKNLNFNTEASNTHYMYDGSSVATSTTKVSLVSAINGYSARYCWSAVDTYLQSFTKTKASAGFTATDRITYSYTSASDTRTDAVASAMTPHKYSASEAYAVPAAEDDIVFFFSIEYSDAAATKLLYHSKADGNTYYTYGSAGSFHPYDGLSFGIGQIRVGVNE